jgi:hypothetical protein
MSPKDDDLIWSSVLCSTYDKVTEHIWEIVLPNTDENVRDMVSNRIFANPAISEIRRLVWAKTYFIATE